jgi:hypothetical protein
MLLRFSYVDIVNIWWQEREKPADDDLAFFIASSFQQAKSYFDASLSAQINIKPLLMYYGSINLLIGTLSLVKHNRFDISSHGMVLDDKSIYKSCDILSVNLVPKDQKGALHTIALEMEGVNDILNRGAWSLQEVLRTIPDLALEYQFIFPHSGMNVVFCEEVQHNGRLIDRIPIVTEEEGISIIQNLKLNKNFLDTYLEPQTTPQYVILNRKPGGKTFEQYSIAGERYLPIPLKKGGLVLPQYLMMYLGLYILGTLSRYNPEIWDGFIRYDSSGRKNLINSFLSITERYFPNVILNIISGERIQFRT